MSTAFDALHPGLQRWVWDQGWSDLRDAQQRALQPIIEGHTDVVISAATASGKTEAAFLPICSAINTELPRAGLDVLYVSPLKALINDQGSRLEELCSAIELPTHRWHGDISSSAKAKALNGNGVLLITPESLEAIFVRRGSQTPKLFGNLRYIVIDELHAFIDTDRGRQLQSLLHRVDLAAKHSTPRIGLSATLGDPLIATHWLRPTNPRGVHVIESRDDSQELRIGLMGFTGARTPVATATQEANQGTTQEDQTNVDKLVAAEIFRILGGRKGLTFANSRYRVEVLSDELRNICSAKAIPVQFFPHHGSLAKDVREDTEARMNQPQPATAVCTSTLELGIDIGSMEAVCQVGPPPSVASLRQRLGRAGRRGEPAVIHLLVPEAATEASSPPDLALHLNVVQSIAMIDLLLSRWFEPPRSAVVDFSTLVQQTLSLIAERNGVTPSKAYEVLCGPGPFQPVTAQQFALLLKDLGQGELIMQLEDNTLLLAPRGEKMVGHFDFYSAFALPREFRLVAAGKTLGTLPITSPVFVGALVVFSGRRWRVENIDLGNNVIDLAPATAGVAPAFGGDSPELHRRVHQQMRTVYESTQVPPYLDDEAKSLLASGRDAYARMSLATQSVVQHRNNAYVFHWSGDLAGQTICVGLGTLDIAANNEGPLLVVPRTTADDVIGHLSRLASGGRPAPAYLARTVANTRIAKHDGVLCDPLAQASYASRVLDVDSAWNYLESL